MANNGLPPRQGAHTFYEDYGIDWASIEQDTSIIHVPEQPEEDDTITVWVDNYDDIKTWINLTFSVWWLVWIVMLIVVLTLVF